MKNFLKTLLALTLITAFLLAGCEKLDWQTITCDIQTYEGNVFRDGDTLSYGESRDIDGYQEIRFKLPKEYYQTNDSGDYENEKTWTDGSTIIAIFGIKLVDAKEYFEYEEYAYNTNESNAKQRTRTKLTNGIVKSTIYPRVDVEGNPLTDDKPSVHGHLVDTTLGSSVVRFTVYEYCTLGSPVISDETIEFIQTIANSFE